QASTSRGGGDGSRRSPRSPVRARRLRWLVCVSWRLLSRRRRAPFRFRNAAVSRPNCPDAVTDRHARSEHPAKSGRTELREAGNRDLRYNRPGRPGSSYTIAEDRGDLVGMTGRGVAAGPTFSGPGEGSSMVEATVAERFMAAPVLADVDPKSKNALL